VETTETQGISLEDAAQSLLAPQETEAENELTEEEAQVTDESEIEDSAETEVDDLEDSEEIEDSDEDYSEEDLSDEGEAIDDAAQEVNEELIEVKVDGQSENVTLEELKQGYSGQKYVQKKMQEAAQQRKEAEEVFTTLQNERQKVADLFKQMQSGKLATPPVPPSEELFESDPIEYMDQKIKYDRAQKQYADQVSKFEELAKENSAAEQRARQIYMKEQMEQLNIAIPELANPNTRNQLKEKMIEAGTTTYGYSQEEISQVMDHRALKVLHDAMKYQEIIAGKDKAVKKTKKARPVVKAGAKKLQSKPNAKKVRDRQMAQLKQSGKLDDAISLIMENA
jgi:hypothetical protein